MKKQILLLLLFFALLVNAAKAQDTSGKTQDENDDAPIKVDTLLLTVPLTVSDRSGRNVTGLKKEDFSIFQNGKKQSIEYFFNEDAPMNVAILIDTSGSTKEVLGKLQKAARDFVKVFRPEDKGIIVTFDYRTSFLTELASDKKMLSKAINNARIADKAGSDMNEAVSLIVKNYFSSFKGRKAIIVLTDGMVIRRAISTQETLETLQKADTLFYPIIFKTKFYADARARAAANNRKPLPIEMLEFLAQQTLGKSYEKEATNLNEAFENIAEELKKQYLIGFYPLSTEAGKPRGSIRIAVNREGCSIETKKRWGF